MTHRNSPVALLIDFVGLHLQDEPRPVFVTRDRKRQIVTTSNPDTPIVHGQTPLLVIDVWEHAYYLDQQEHRAAYVAGVVEHLLNWEFAGRAFERAAGRASP